MNDHDLIARQEGDLMSTTLDGELVGISVEHGMCYGFDEIATRVWELLAVPCRFNDLCGRLTSEFDVDEETCRRDVRALIDALHRDRLVSVTPAA